MDRYCATCGELLEPDSPAWAKLCRDCFFARKRAEQDAVRAELAAAQEKVAAARRLVLGLQAEVRALEGQLRTAQGMHGVGQRPDGAAGDQLELFTPEELRWMRLKLHPDKHGGAAMAGALTAKLNTLLKNRDKA